MTLTGVPPSRAELLDSLSEAILDDRTPPGTKLPSERQLAEQHSLSRPIVREALRSLAERGLVTIVPGRGAYVRAAEAGDLAGPMDAIARQTGATPRHLIEARDMLERRACALAAERATEEEVAELTEAVEAFDAADNVLDRARSDLRFHALLAKASHNPVVMTMFGAIAPLVFEMQLRSLDDPQVVAEGGPLHRQVLDAVRDRRPDEAAAAMHTHVTLAYELFGADLDATLDALARRKVAGIFGGSTSLEDVMSTVLGRPNKSPGAR